MHGFSIVSRILGSTNVFRVAYNTVNRVSPRELSALTSPSVGGIHANLRPLRCRAHISRLRQAEWRLSGRQTAHRSDHLDFLIAAAHRRWWELTRSQTEWCWQYDEGRMSGGGCVRASGLPFPTRPNPVCKNDTSRAPLTSPREYHRKYCHSGKLDRRVRKEPLHGAHALEETSASDIAYPSSRFCL